MSKPKQGAWDDVCMSVGTYHIPHEAPIELTIVSAKCSECGLYAYNLQQYSKEMTAYCPHCGTKMEG